MSGSNCCFLTCIQISQGDGKVFSIPISWRTFHSFFVIHIVKGFSVVNETEVDVTNLENIFKSRDITLPTRSLWSNLWFSELNMYGYESWTLKNAFKLWYWRRLLKVPWISRVPWISSHSLLKLLKYKTLEQLICHFTEFTVINSCCAVAQLYLTLCDCSTRGFLVFHYVPEFVQMHVHWVSDAIQLSHPLSPHSPPAFNLSQDHGLIQRVDAPHQVRKVLELQHQSFKWIFKVDFL